MEHRCHRCAANVKPGAPFCKQCGAPQIRVPAMEGEDIANSSRPRPGRQFEPGQGDAGRSGPGGDREPLWMPAPPADEPRSTIDWSRALPAVAWAALLEAVFTFFGLGLLVGGFLSVLFYRRRQPQQTISVGMGAKLGMVSGGLGFFILAIVLSLGTVFFHTGSDMHDAILRSLEEAGRRNPAPQAQQALEYLKSPQGFGLMLALGLMATLIFFLILSSLGGALGATTLRRRNRS